MTGELIGKTAVINGATRGFGRALAKAFGRAQANAVTNTNILGVYNGSITAMQHFLPRRTGTLINITGRGDRGPQPMHNAYALSKAWMRSFTECLAREYQNSGVKLYAFNADCRPPGFIRCQPAPKNICPPDDGQPEITGEPQAVQVTVVPPAIDNK
jgi:NAD(P)-dependent dehydrogenase (short-subunit alcohol dehydrogenase family)